ncbi:acyltransferase [Chelativorans sp. SCAU2101]|jgi:Predicted acyltransferases|uniref:Acyltransferase n=1 Tax=Chelativorans petroleitrophicus TaxID=2975484 RepID=A0A9X3B6L9_9HYPH|nr:acyltransferase family protein [Chelativorans petroleitrophicus]MCT8990668.1 acyltransferase [Chelativorans petroleitrophicus]
MRFHHVDGLRAVAVLSVLFFHVGAAAFSGGFVGVDVFFVISGFVITRQILNLMDDGKFSLFRFYERRLNRLYPALIVTIALSLVAGFLVLPPSLLSDFSFSALASLTAWSNIFFWDSVGYFDTASDLKPLLHTWTLSLEWQYYLVTPVFLWLVPRRYLPHSIFAVSLASLALSSFWWRDPATPFYWMPFRIFEFGLGALLLWMPEPRRAVGDLTVAGGLALTAYAVFSFTGQTPFPSYFALLPALGAAMVIWGGKTGFLSGALRLAPITYLGRISYSTYLVHWPLIVFTVCYTAQDLTTTAAAIICTLSIVLGALLYHSVEKPFWHGRLASRAKVTVFATTVPLAALLYISSGGLWWRIPPPWNTPYPSGLDFHYANFGGAGYPSNKLVRIGSDNAPILFHVMGDSFAHQLFWGLDEELTSRGLAADAINDNGCPMMAGTARLIKGREDTSCTESINTALSIFNDGLPILFALSWNGYRYSLLSEGKHVTFDSLDQYYDFILDRISATKEATKTPQMIIFGDVPRSASVKLTPFECTTSPRYLSDTPPCQALMYARLTNELLSQRFRELMERDESIVVLDPRDYLCSDTNDCPVFEDGNLIYSDGGHLSKFGSRMIARRLLDDVLAAIANPGSGASENGIATQNGH